MNVYVAGRFTKKSLVREAQAALREAGHTITFDWTNEDTTGLKSENRLQYLAAAAYRDQIGVESADAILVMHDDTGRGLFVEFGLALSDKSKLIVVVGGMRGKHPEGCVFYYLPRVRHFCTLEGAVEFITQAGR
jgi:hypothetical protein